MHKSNEGHSGPNWPGQSAADHHAAVAAAIPADAVLVRVDGKEATIVDGQNQASVVPYTFDLESQRATLKPVRARGK